MKTIRITLNGILEVQCFVSILEKHSGNFDLRCGRKLVDAKSILGILSLDLSRPLNLIIYDEDHTILKDLAPFRNGFHENGQWKPFQWALP